MDAPTCKNVVLARAVGSMPEFKQIIGRGTRLRPDYGKLAFNIVDYTGTAADNTDDRHTWMICVPSFPSSALETLPMPE